MKKLLILGLLAFSSSLYAENNEELSKEELMRAIKEGNVESVTRILKAGIQKSDLTDAAHFALDKIKNEIALRAANEEYRLGSTMLSLIYIYGSYMFFICRANHMQLHESLVMSFIPAVAVPCLGLLVKWFGLDQPTIADPQVNTIEIARLVALSAYSAKSSEKQAEQK